MISTKKTPLFGAGKQFLLLTKNTGIDANNFIVVRFRISAAIGV